MKVLLIISFCILASCVEPPRIPVQGEDGLVYMVRRPNFEAKDTVLMVSHYNYIDEIGPTRYIVGNYIGIVPESDTLRDISRHYSIVTIIK